MTVSELIGYLRRLDGDLLVFLDEAQAADELSEVEHPEYVTLDYVASFRLDYDPTLCQRCSSPLVGGLCSDETCPHSEPPD